MNIRISDHHGLVKISCPHFNLGAYPKMIVFGTSRPQADQFHIDIMVHIPAVIAEEEINRH